MVYAFTKLRYELNSREEEKKWDKLQPGEEQKQEFFFPKRLQLGNKTWNRRYGENTLSYYNGTTEDDYQKYHITISKDNIPEQLSLHETTPDTKGDSDKDSIFIVKHGKLEWNGKPPYPSDNMKQLVQEIERYQQDRYQSLILDNRKDEVQETQPQEIQNEQLFPMRIRKTVKDLEAAKSLQLYLLKQFQGIKVEFGPLSSKSAKYSVSINKKAEPLELNKLNEAAVHKAFEDWSKDNAQSSTPTPQTKSLASEGSSIATATSDAEQTHQQTAETTTSAVGGPLSPYENPELFPHNIAQTTEQLNPDNPAAPSPLTQPKQITNTDSKPKNEDDSPHNKLRRQDWGGRGPGGRRPS